MATWENIIVHCSDSEFGNAITIDKWHRDKGWSGCGYHFVITNGYPFSYSEYFDLLDGQIESGRFLNLDAWAHDNEQGAHALGYNHNSIGICLIGKERFTDEQFRSLRLLIERLKQEFPSITSVMGHYQTDSGARQGKTCPNFDVDDFMAKEMNNGNNQEVLGVLVNSVIGFIGNLLGRKPATQER